MPNSGLAAEAIAAPWTFELCKFNASGKEPNHPHKSKYERRNKRVK
jgi:hypothetical protein